MITLYVMLGIAVMLIFEVWTIKFEGDTMFGMIQKAVNHEVPVMDPTFPKNRYITVAKVSYALSYVLWPLTTVILLSDI